MWKKKITVVNGNSLLIEEITNVDHGVLSILKDNCTTSSSSCIYQITKLLALMGFEEFKVNE